MNTCIPTKELEQAIASEMNNEDVEGEAFIKLMEENEILARRLLRGTDISVAESSPKQVCKEI